MNDFFTKKKRKMMSWWPNLPHPDRTWIRPYHSSFPWMLKAQNIGNSLAWCSLGAAMTTASADNQIFSLKITNGTKFVSHGLAVVAMCWVQKKSKNKCVWFLHQIQKQVRRQLMLLSTLFFSLSKPCTAKTAIPSFPSH